MDAGSSAEEVPDWFVACILITWAVGVLLSTAVFVVLDGKRSRGQRHIVVLNPQVWCANVRVRGVLRASVARLPKVSRLAVRDRTVSPAHDSPRGSLRPARPPQRRRRRSPVRLRLGIDRMSMRKPGSRGQRRRFRPLCHCPQCHPPNRRPPGHQTTMPTRGSPSKLRRSAGASGVEAEVTPMQGIRRVRKTPWDLPGRRRPRPCK